MQRSSEEKKGKTERSPVSEISDDILVEIISRVPYKFTRRCKCVCRRWHDLISHPDHRKKLPWSTLAGFFYQTYKRNRKLEVGCSYHSVSGNWCPRVDGTLSFLPRRDKLGIDILDSCNGLLLLRPWKLKGPNPSKALDYIVCNPATETWVAVPPTEWSGTFPHTRLGFNPAISSHFHVFEFVHEQMWESYKGICSWRIKSVGIYSSETGVWTHRSACNRPTAFDSISRSVFLDGVLYLSSFNDLVIVAVDVEGNCRVIRFPTTFACGADVYLSSGQLYLANYGHSELSIWALEDSSCENWILKHNVSYLRLFGKECSWFVDYGVIIHPEHTFIFIVCTKVLGCDQSVTKLMSYEIDSRELCFMCDLPGGHTPSYIPYVPLFSESLADGH
jgi:F-box interacting protein